LIMRHSSALRLSIPRKAAAAAACLFAALPTVCHGATPHFVDRFDSGASALWGNEQGNWGAERGFYRAANPSTFPNARSLLPFMLRDFTVEFDAIDISDGGPWLRSAAAPGSSVGQSGVLLVLGGLGGTGDGLYWHVTHGGGYGAILNERRGLFTPGVSDAHIRVTVQGDTYSAFVNGSATAASTLVTPLFAEGFTGLYGYWPRRDLPAPGFDNFELNPQAIPEPGTWALLSAGLAACVVVGRQRRPGRTAA
jgi:hypothetical protein